MGGLLCPLARCPPGALQRFVSMAGMGSKT